MAKSTSTKLTFETYNKCFEFYKDSDHTPKTLAREFGLSTAIARKLIADGFPEYGWPGLQQRAAMLDTRRLYSDQDGEDARDKQRFAEWDSARHQNLTIVKATRNLLVPLLQKAQKVAMNAEFVNYRTFKMGDKIETIKVDMNAKDMADTLRTIVGTLKDLSSLDAYWLGDRPVETHEAGIQRHVGALTQAQLDYISSTGQLPPGVTDDMVFGAAFGGRISARN